MVYPDSTFGANCNRCNLPFSGFQPNSLSPMGQKYLDLGCRRTH